MEKLTNSILIANNISSIQINICIKLRLSKIMSAIETIIIIIDKNKIIWRI